MWLLPSEGVHSHPRGGFTYHLPHKFSPKIHFSPGVHLHPPHPLATPLWCLEAEISCGMGDSKHCVCVATSPPSSFCSVGTLCSRWISENTATTPWTRRNSQAKTALSMWVTVTSTWRIAQSPSPADGRSGSSAASSANRNPFADHGVFFDVTAAHRSAQRAPTLTPRPQRPHTLLGLRPLSRPRAGIGQAGSCMAARSEGRRGTVLSRVTIADGKWRL